jgi:decaprenylphospho-beta-D-erythro-pentofuranosid-2-ulose 2-reductase
MSTFLLGSSSGIGKEIANLLIQSNYSEEIILSSSTTRDKEAIVNNIKINYINCDLNSIDSINAFIQKLINGNVLLNKIIITAGVNQNKEYNYQNVRHLYNVNLLGIMHLINSLLEREIISNASQIICISSLASVRGRASNYYYSGTKSALNHYLSGKRMELQNRKIQISTVLLGPSRTRLIKQNNILKFLSISKESAANQIYKILKHHKDRVFIPKFGWIIYFIISIIPESIFKKFNF